MPKLFIFLLFCSISLFAKAPDEKMQILAANVVTSDNVLNANGNVIVYSKDFYITANRLIYDKNKETFELFGNVLIIKNNTLKSQSEYAFLDIKKDTLFQNPSFLIDTNSNVWIDTKEVNKNKEKFSFGSAVISSCDCINPMWSLRFSSGSYDENNQWIQAYNARLYIKSIPVLYTPYFAFPTDTTRRSGLLKPTIGISKTEGFTYFQPIYFAPKDNYDIELMPQYKQLRGKGLYAYYRYIDSQYSKLDIKTGIFKENASYFKKNNITNQEHYGFDLDYKRTNLFSNNQENKDGLFTSLTYLNDIEYITLEGPKYSTSTNKNIESKINYYFDTPSYYFGTYLRYYLDRSFDNNTKDIKNNDSTIQQLPQVQAHKYLDSFISEKLTYSVDSTHTTFSRKNGLNASVNDLTLPIALNFSLFDNYLNLEFKEELYINKTLYSNTNTPYDDATFVESRRSVSLGSDLIRPYSTFIHSLTLTSQFNFVDNLKKEGDIYKISGNNKNDSSLSPFSITESRKSISLSINQSFYSQKDLKQILNHKITQNITYDKNDNAQLSNLENEITYNHNYGSLYNRLLFSNVDNKIIENSSTAKFDFSKVDVDFGYYNSKNTPNSNKEDLESASFALKYDYSKKFYFKYSQNFNIKEKFKSKESYILGFIEDCWAITLKYENELVASSSVNQGIRQNIIYLNLELIPIGAFKQQYKINDN